ncbi:hypothetical protein Tco_0031828 [Tanacetum coccineum]
MLVLDFFFMEFQYLWGPMGFDLQVKGCMMEVMFTIVEGYGGEQIRDVDETPNSSKAVLLTSLQMVGRDLRIFLGFFGGIFFSLGGDALHLGKSSPWLGLREGLCNLVIALFLKGELAVRGSGVRGDDGVITGSSLCGSILLANKPLTTVEDLYSKDPQVGIRACRETLKDHLAKFHKMTDAKEMWEAIKSRFGGNDESKKMQKYILKQQFEGFSVSNSEGLHKGYDRFQSLLSQLEIHGAGVSTEDANQKFLRSLPFAWSQVSLIMRTKPGVDSLSFDDLYNNLRVFESDVKGSTASSSSTHRMWHLFQRTLAVLMMLVPGFMVSFGLFLILFGSITHNMNILIIHLTCISIQLPTLDHERSRTADEFELEGSRL